MSTALRALAVLVSASAALAGCSRTRPAGISIAEQFGLAYAPVQLVRERRLLEQGAGSPQVSWQRMSNTAAIREAMVAGRVDVGFVAIPPFLVGRDNGMKWRIVTGLSRSPVALVTWKPGVTRLADFAAGDRIAVPQPGSVQHILLAMAAERELGDAARFDGRLVTMAHPDGMAAMLARGDIAAHFTTPPYLRRELSEPGFRQVLSGVEAAGGDFTFVVAVATEAALERAPASIAALVRALEQAAASIARSPAEAAATLAPLYGMEASAIERELAAMSFEGGIQGVERFADFMRRRGYLKAPAEPLRELLWTAPGAPPAGRRQP